MILLSATRTYGTVGHPLPINLTSQEEQDKKENERADDKYK